MKKIAFLMALCAIAFVSCNKDDDKKKNDEKTPETEEARVLENFENGGILTWTGANGCSFVVVENPAKSGVNTSASVGLYTTDAAEWDFVWTTGFGETGTGEFEFLDFTNDGYIIKVDVYAPVADMPIYCKLEGVNVESKEISNVKTTKANEWETLEFDFEPMGVVDGAYKNFVFCVDAGGTTAGTEVYLDNVRQVAGE